MTAAFTLQLSMRQIELISALLAGDATELLTQPHAITTARALERRGFVTTDAWGWTLTWAGELLATLVGAISSSDPERAMNRLPRKATR